ncbi:hypothetical protein ASPZODRAFT_399542 [Penicilliopsis zonata CBS 506.65]|uniref:AB hydrolase-1 domain-containing protein n=1 Tax=Penicilliopsis zonata CBS 506.65 TaxID=1073090 RepID=A0A1L9SWM0_9EURO|nr:hypothetical protein ASPZODRAFT_399542 [Penicilliopsis zonata CBS 506.65]OJJ51501.1 hypothetical protein ASPZODRAFT_399542 [Penicilliopsis zonata CBS 506.65]
MSSKSHSGVLHQYAPKLVAFEFASSSSDAKKPNSLLFIGGLTDGLCTVPYVEHLAKALEDTDWSVFSVLLSTSYKGWGVGSLDKDIEEIAKCVRFVRDYKAESELESEPGKVVIMGHSTGSQDVLHYLCSENPTPYRASGPKDKLEHVIRPEVDGAILQAPVSDREALMRSIRNGTATCTPGQVAGDYGLLVDFARRQPFTPDGINAVLPLNMTAKLGFPEDTPLSSRRFFSLASPDSPQKPSEDDLFSSDLTDERLQRTFGAIAKRDLLRSKLLVLYSGKDEHVPDWVDKEALLQRWESASGDKWGEAPTQELVDKVIEYLARI